MGSKNSTCGEEDSAVCDYVICVKTGDKKNSGTDSDIHIRLNDDAGKTTGIHKLDVLFRNDFERGRTDCFTLKGLPKIGNIKELEIMLEQCGRRPDWYLERIVVEHKAQTQAFLFPCNRWLRESVDFLLAPYDCCLPQNSPHAEQRRLELEYKRKIYEYDQKHPGFPVQVKTLPEDEVFSDDYQFDLATRQLKLVAREAIIEYLNDGSEYFTCLDEVRDVFRRFPTLEEPSGVHTWSSDVNFGEQRLNSCNPKLIRLCKEIPEKFGVDPKCVEPFLGGIEFQTALERLRLYMVDLEIMEGIYHVEGTTLCSPLALFFVTDEKTLIPVAIQLFQQKGPDNPVFYPNDDPYTWLMAKMWFNNADANYHQSCTHLGSTHLLMEGLVICSQRNLSPSHPIYKLLAPHFLYLMAINARSLVDLLNPGGWIDLNMTAAVKGVVQLVGKRHAEFIVNVDADILEDLKNRGVDSESLLPNYYYRDDGLLLNEAISNYAKKMVELYYTCDEDVQKDEELQAFGREMVAPKLEGLGLKGIPDDGKFSTRECVIQMARMFIFICSAEHGAVNFNQYDAYAFPPNYPAVLRGYPPKDKTPRTEKDIVDQLPTKKQMMDTMIITKILSTRSTRPLGDFEVVYHHEPEALKIAREFQDELKEVSKKIRAQNATRRFSYTVLDPSEIPNSISI